MRSYKESWSLFLTLSMVAASFSATGCKSMPGANYFAKKEAPSASSLAGQAPAYGATPASTSSPTPSQASLAARNQNAITPNYAGGMSNSHNPYVAQSGQGMQGQSMQGSGGAQPQQGFYSPPTGYTASGSTANNPYAAYPNGYAQQTPPQGSAYGMPGPTSPYAGQPMPSGYSAQTGTTSGTGASAYTASANTGSSYGYGGNTAPTTAPTSSSGSVYSSPTTGGTAPTSGGGYNYPSTDYPQTNYPSTSGSYDSTASYSATGEGSQAPSYRPGGTSDYDSTQGDSTPTWSQDYPTSTYTR